MSQSFSLRGNHRDTFRLIPVGSTDPGDYIHVPTNPSGLAFFTASPANYQVLCRPAYTGEFILLNSSVDGGYQYLRTLNPEIDSDGIISLTALVNNLTINMDSANGNLPYITAEETLSIRVLSTAGGVPTSELQQAPDVTVYKKQGGTGDAVVVGTATYDQAAYDTAQPHIYHYTYSFTTSDDQDLYYLQAFASYENILSPGYPDTVYFYLDYIPPVLHDQASIASSSSADAGFTPTTTVVGVIPESSITDDQSGPGLVHLQPYMGSLVQTNDPTPAPGGLKYIGWNASGYHQFDEDHLDDWAMTVSSGYMLVLTDNNGKDFLYNNHGAGYPTVNQYTLHNIGSAGTTKEIHIPDVDINGGPLSGGSDSATFTVGNYYQYKLFPSEITAYCKDDPAITSKATCEATGTCDDGTSTTAEDCATANASWTYYTWLDNQGAVADWPIQFSHGGNLTQSLSLTQHVDPGFIDDLEGIEYGYLISATDNAKNTNITWSQFLKPSIVYDTIVEVAPNLSWAWIKNPNKTDESAFTNENGWFNVGEDFLNDGWCDDDSGDNQQDCCTNNSGVWNNNSCTGASTSWIPDSLTLLVTCTNDTSQQDNLFGVQASFDGTTWTEFSGSGNAYLVNGQTSQFWINLSSLIKQGSHNLYVRSVNTDGGATGNTYAINYKWDKQKPVWSTVGTLTATGGFNRANITWTDGPVDDGESGTPNEVGTGGDLSAGEGFSGANQIRLYRSLKTGSTPDNWTTVSNSPSTYELVELGIFPSTIKEYTDTSFYNVQYDAEVIDPYYYWGVPIDVAGNEGQDIRLSSHNAILLTSSAGVEVTPLVAADVAGALGTTIAADANDSSSLITHNDISVPITGLVIRTDDLNVVRAVKELSYSADGFTYTSLPIVKRLGEDYPVLYADLSNNGTTMPGGLAITITDTLDNLGLSHLDGVTGTGGKLGLSYIRTAQCNLGSGYLGSPTESACETNGGAWEETLTPVLIDSVSDNSGSSPTTILLDSIENTYQASLVSKFSDSEWRVDIGLFLLDNTVYAFDDFQLQNQYYFKTTFDAAVPTAGYCFGFPAYTTQTTCESNSKTWLPSWVDTEHVQWTSQLAADLIVGGTLRLETGLSIWSGGYVNGEPQGTGLTMDELGLRMFNSSNTTVEMDASDGSFAMGDLTSDSGSKLLYDPAQGQLTLIGNLYQVQPDVGSYNPSFTGDWTAGSCSDGTSTTEELCCTNNTGTWTGTACNPAGTATWTPELYNSGDVVLYLGQYWLCIGTNVESIPSLEENLDWTLYASGSIKGDSAKSLFINAASQYFVSNEDGIIQNPSSIKVNVNTQGVSASVTWSIEAKDTTGTTINCAGSNGINLYTDATNTIESSLVLSPSTPVYLYASNFQAVNAAEVELTCSYSELAQDGSSLVSLEDTVSIVRLTEGASTYNVILSNESHTVFADEFGNVDASDWIASQTNVQLYRGSELRECTVSSSPLGANWTSHDTQANLPSFPTVQLKNETNASADPLTGQALITITDTLSGDTFDSIFGVTKVLAGSSERSVSLLPTSNTFVYDPNGQVIVSPGTEYIDVTVGLQGGVNPSTLSWTLEANDQSWSIPTYNAGGSYTDLTDNLVIQSNSNDPSVPHIIRINLTGPYDLYKSADIVLSLSLSDSVSDTNTTLTYNDSITITRLNTGTDTVTGSLSNDSFSVTADYTGETGELTNAGGLFSMYQGSTLINNAEFSTVGSWYARLYKEDTADDIVASLEDLTISNLLSHGAPDKVKMKKWTDLDAVSTITMGGSGTKLTGDPVDGPNFFDEDCGDNFVIWATTYVKTSDAALIDEETVVGGKSEWVVYIDGIRVAGFCDSAVAEQCGGTYWFTGATANAANDAGHGTSHPSNWGSDPTENTNAPDDRGNWHRIDMLYHNNSGDDYVQLGFNPSQHPELSGSSAVVCDINSTTGEYDVLYLDPSVHIPGGKQWFKGVTSIDDGNGGLIDATVEKEYTISKAYAGNPGTYYKSVYLTVGITTVSALEAAITVDGGDLFGTHDWPPSPENDDLEGLDGWINSPPPDALPGLTTWETRKLYRIDNTEIEGEAWSTPFVAGSVPLDPIIYYLKPTNGTSILNGEGTLTVVATQQDQTNGESQIDVSTNIRIATADDGGSLLASNNESFTSSNINGTLTLYLIDTGNNNAVLDTLTLVDVTDGQPTGIVVGDPGLVFTQTGPNNWSPGTITVSSYFYDVNGNIEGTTTGVLAVDSSGNISIQTMFNLDTISVSGSGENTNQFGLTFSLISDPTRFVQETFYSVSQGETGETGNTGAAGPSVVYTGGWQVDRGVYYAGTFSGLNDEGASGDPLGEIVRFDHTSPNSPKEWHEDHGAYYICTTQHDPVAITPADTGGAVNSPYWQAFGAQFESVATGLLLAETVIAQDMFGETLELTDSFKISSPSGTCTNIAMNLDDADGSGQLGGADDASADHNTWNGHWQTGTHRGLLHNDWNSANETTFNLTEATVIAVNSYDVTGTSYKEELLALQPGSIIELYTDANIDQSAGDLAQDFYDTPFYFKIEEDPIKLGAGQPTGVYMASTLADVGPTDEYGNNNVSLDVVQLDVLHLPTLPDGTVGNNTTSTFPYDSGVGIKLRIHSGFSTEGECLANGGTWTPNNQRVELTSSGLQAYNGGGDRTVNIKSSDGDFEFGNFDSGQGIKYSSGSLQMNGSMIIDGTPVNDQMRSVSLNTEVPSFIFQKAYLNFAGSLVSESPYPVVGSGTPYCQGAASWTFTTDNDGPLLIRVAMNDPEGRPSIALNGTELGIGTDGSYKAYYGHHEGATDGEGAEVQRWYEWYDDGTHAIFGQNTIQLVCSTEVSNCDDAFTLTAVQVFGDVNTEAITINSTVLNGGASPTPVWEATQTGNISHSGWSPTINLATTTDSSATITLTEFMNHQVSSALRSTAVTVQAYYAGGNQSPPWSSDISDILTITRLLPGLPGEQAITGMLTNESGTIAMDHSGDWNNGGNVLAEHGGLFQIYDGLSLVPPSDVTYTATASTGTTCYILDPSGDFAITAISGTDTGVCTLEAAYGGVTIQKVFTLALSREGATIIGDPAKGVIVSADSSVYILHEDTTLTPNVMGFTAQCINCTTDGSWTVEPAGIFQSTDNTYTSPSAAISNTFFTDEMAISYCAHADDGGACDQVIIEELIAGDSAITVVMSNEAHVLPADVNGAVVDYTGSGTEIRVYQGSTELQYDGSQAGPGKWNISSTSDSGDIVYDGFTDGGSYAEGGEITSTTDAVDSFTITYTIQGHTLNNEAFTNLTKTRSISKSKTGAAGESGAPSMSHTFTYDTIDGEELSPLNYPSHNMGGGGWSTTGGSNPTVWSVDQTPPAGGPGGPAYKAIDDATNIGNSHAQLWGDWIDIDPQNFYKISVWVYQDGGNQRQYLACDFKSADGEYGTEMSPTTTPNGWDHGTYYYWRVANQTYPANTWTYYEFTMCPDGYSGPETCDGGMPLATSGINGSSTGSPTVAARVGALVNRDHTGSSQGDQSETATTVWFTDYKIERITTDDDGRFKVWSGDQSDWTESSDTTGFQNANMMLLNKKDTNGTDRSYIYDNLAVGQEVVFFINNNRWYQYIIDEAINEPNGLGDTVGLLLSYKAHIVDIDSSLSGDIDALDVKFGFSALQGVDGDPGVRGSRHFYQFIDPPQGDGSSIGFNPTLATTIASEAGGPFERDTVTQFNETHEFSLTKYYTPGNGTTDEGVADSGDWALVTQVVDGNLIVHGTIGADQIEAGSVSAIHVAANSITADKIQIGPGGNLVWPQPKDVDSWADFEGYGWDQDYADQTAVQDVQGYDSRVQEEATKRCLVLSETGTSPMYIFTNMLPIDSSQSYNITATFKPRCTTGNVIVNLKLYVEFYEQEDDNTVLKCVRVYKNGIKDNDWEDDAWHLELEADGEGHPVWQAGSIKPDNPVGTGGLGNGWIMGYNYDDYWWEVNCMMHSAATSNDGLKSGGALPWMATQLRGLHLDGADTGNADGVVGNLRIPSGADSCRLAWRADVNGNASDGDLHFEIASMGLTPAGTTMIDGSSISTGSITADKISVNILTANDLTADNIVATGSIRSANDQTFWNLEEEVFIVKDASGVVRVKIGDLTASDNP